MNMKLHSYLRVIIQTVKRYWKWIILWANFPQRRSAVFAKSSCICKRRLWLIALNKFSPLQQGKRIFIHKGQGTRSGLPTTRTVTHAHHAWGGCQFKLYRTTAATAFDHEVSFLKVDTVFLHSTSVQARSTSRNIKSYSRRHRAGESAREGQIPIRYWQKLTVDPRMIYKSKYRDKFTMTTFTHSSCQHLSVEDAEIYFEIIGNAIGSPFLLRSQIKGCAFLNIPYAGHEAYNDSPVLFMQVAHDFLVNQIPRKC